MERIHLNGLNIWQFANLAQCEKVNHFVTDRNTGEAEFTLSLSSTPDKERVRKNRSKLAEAMDVDPSLLLFPSQVHETRIVKVTRSTMVGELHATDALITAERGVCIAVMSADCVPILLYDMKNNAVAAVHSGWRGTVARILEKTLARMKSDFGTKGEDIVARIGPSVSQESYEVGEEVINEVHRAFSGDHELLVGQPQNKARLDLWKANRVQLIEFGVPESQIEVSNLCTVKHNQHFFSARKGDTGRFAAGILIR